jgi:hypothetical protein
VTLPARRFPPPWTVEELSTSFVVRDDNGQKLASILRTSQVGARRRTR